MAWGKRSIPRSQIEPQIPDLRFQVPNAKPPSPVPHILALQVPSVSRDVLEK